MLRKKIYIASDHAGFMLKEKFVPFLKKSKFLLMILGQMILLVVIIQIMHIC